MERSLNIAFFGSSLVSAYWNGAATYYRGIIRALYRLGHRVTFYEPDAFERQEHRDIDDPEYARCVVYDATEQAGRAVLDEARDADVIVKASGVGVFDALLEQEVLEACRPGGVRVFWDVDAPATLDRVNNDPSDHFGRLIPRYDLVLTYGGGHPVVNAYKRLGARRCVPIYNALDPDIHHPAPPEKRLEAGLSFLGNRMPDREERVKEFFFKPAAQLPEKRFILGGSGWDCNVPELPNVDYIGHVYTRDHNAFNCTPTAVLNISRESMARYGFSPATRVFEAAGAGACLITDAWEGIDLFLEPGRECLVAESGEQVIEHLRALTWKESRRIGEAARKRVLSAHTYAHRGRKVDRLLHEALENSEALTP